MAATPTPTVSIYGIGVPGERRFVYVGATRRPLPARLKAHRYRTSKRLWAWLRDHPEARIVEIDRVPVDQAEEEETAYIRLDPGELLNVHGRPRRR